MDISIVIIAYMANHSETSALGSPLLGCFNYSNRRLPVGV